MFPSAHVPVSLLCSVFLSRDETGDMYYLQPIPFLNVSVLPLAAHNGPFLRFSVSCLPFDGDGMGTAGVTWEETRGKLGPFIYLSEIQHCALDTVHTSCARAVLDCLFTREKIHD